MQKKLQKLAALLLVCACCAGFLSSCGDDDDNEGKPQSGNLVERLQGTWTFQTMKISVMGQTVEMDADDLRDETGYGGDFYDDVLSFNGNKVNGLDYTVKGNSILLPWYVEQQWWGKVTFSGHKMTIYYDVTYQGVQMKLWMIYAGNGSRSWQTMPVNGKAGNLLPAILDLYRK